MSWFKQETPQTSANQIEEVDLTSTLQFGTLRLDSAEATQHFLAIAATGGGKTTILRRLLQDMIPSIGRGDDARALIYDAKQDAVSMLRGIAPQVELLITNPFDERGVAWNLGRDICESRVAIEFVFTLIAEKQESQPFFSDAVRHLVYGVVTSYNVRGLRWGLADMIRPFSSPTRLQRVLNACQYTRSLIPRYFGDKRLLANILSTAATKLLPFEPVAAAWESAKQTFSVNDWIHGESILLLGNSETSRHPIDALNRCIFKRASDLALNQSESWTRRTYFVVDELSEAGKLDGLVSLAKKGRSKGVCLVLAFQSIAGLRESTLYGRQLTAEILGQIGHRFIGRLECPETAEWASQLFGDQEVRQITVNKTFSETNSTTHNEQFVTRRAVLPSDFMSVAPCDELNGLTAYYLSRVTGAFSANIPGERLFGSELISRADDVPDYVPRPSEVQYLAPWTKEQALQFAPLRPERSLGPRDGARKKRRQPAPEADILDELDDL